jgi:hypothetical protein
MHTFECQDSNAFVWNKAVQNDSVSIYTTFQNRKRAIQHTAERTVSRHF